MIRGWLSSTPPLPPSLFFTRSPLVLSIQFLCLWSDEQAGVRRACLINCVSEVNKFLYPSASCVTHIITTDTREWMEMSPRSSKHHPLSHFFLVFLFLPFIFFFTHDADFCSHNRPVVLQNWYHLLRYDLYQENDLGTFQSTESRPSKQYANFTIWILIKKKKKTKWINYLISKNIT